MSLGMAIENLGGLVGRMLRPGGRTGAPRFRLPWPNVAEMSAAKDKAPARPWRSCASHRPCEGFRRRMSIRSTLFGWHLRGDPPRRDRPGIVSVPGRPCRACPGLSARRGAPGRPGPTSGPAAQPNMGKAACPAAGRKKTGLTAVFYRFPSKRLSLFGGLLRGAGSASPWLRWRLARPGGLGRLLRSAG
jgi:hypothetical protein